MVKLNFLWFSGHLWKMARLDGRLWKMARLDGRLWKIARLDERLWKIARLTPVFVILPVFLWFSACSGRSWAVWQTDQERSECALNHKITAKSQLLIFLLKKYLSITLVFQTQMKGTSLNDLGWAYPSCCKTLSRLGLREEASRYTVGTSIQQSVRLSTWFLWLHRLCLFGSFRFISSQYILIFVTDLIEEKTNV